MTARERLPEGWSPEALYYWIWQLRWWKTPEENAGLIPVTVGYLMEAARTGVWDTAIYREA